MKAEIKKLIDEHQEKIEILKDSREATKNDPILLDDFKKEKLDEMDQFIEKIKKEYEPRIEQLLIEYRVEVLQGLEDAQEAVNSLVKITNSYLGSLDASN